MTKTEYELYQMQERFEQLRNESQTLINQNKTDEARAKLNEAKDLKAKIEEKRESMEAGNKATAEFIAEHLKVEREKSGSLYKNAVYRGESFGKFQHFDEEEKKADLGKYIKGALTTVWDGAKREHTLYHNYTTATNTIVIPEVLSAQIIDYARDKMVFADVPVIPMDRNNLTIAKVVKDPEFIFKPEASRIKNYSNLVLGKVELKSKTAYGVFKITEEVLYSSNISEIIMSAAAKAFATVMDKYALYGKGIVKATNVTEEEEDSLEISDTLYENYEPKGILTYEDINILEAQEAVETSKYTPFIKAVGMVNSANLTPNTMAFNSGLDTSLQLLTNNNGDPLTAPTAFTGLKKIVSNAMQDKNALIFDRDSIVMGVQQKLLIDTAKNFEDGTYLIRLMAFVDYAVTNPKGITLIKYK